MRATFAAFGPAAFTASGASNFLKFSSNFAASCLAVASYAALSAQALRGFSNSAGTPGQTVGNAQAKRMLSYEFSVRQLAFERGVHHGARVLQAHALAHAEGAAGPAGVHQPALRLVLAQAAAQHLRIDACGGSGRNGDAKQVENSGTGSLPRPASVPASFAVYPERK